MDQTLTQIGLSPEETQVYLSLLEAGTQSAIELAKSTSVKRTYVYRICENLTSKGLATQGKKGRTTVYSPASPDRLVSLAEAQKNRATESFNSLNSLLPTLKSKFTTVDEKPTVTYYEGIEGIKKVYRDTLKENKTIFALVETSKVNQEVYNWVTTKYISERIKRGINVKAIVASGAKTKIYTGLNKKELRDAKTIPSSEFPFENEINLYGTKLAIINNRAGKTLMGIIIDNPTITKTFKSWFNLTWNNI